MTGRLPKKAGANAQNANALQPGNATELQTEYVPISEVRQHEQNPRNGDVELIAESVAINGVYKPIVTARDGTILAGNHSYQSFLSLGHEFVNIVRLDLDPDSAEAKRVMLADNRTSDVGQYDDQDLANLLQSIDDDLVGTGFTDTNLSDLQAILEYREHSTMADNLTDSVGSGKAVTEDGAARTASFEGYLENYRDSDTRSIILPFNIEEYGQVIDLLAQARTKASVETNTHAIRAALDSYVNG